MGYQWMEETIYERQNDTKNYGRGTSRCDGIYIGGLRY